MPTDSAFLLAGLLVAIAVGAWAFGQFLDRDAALPTKISADYIRGLNLVLSQKTDEALELFIQMAKVDEDTLETHFALGHLFRRRGEFDRAIRVHENLLQRENLNDMQYDQAISALADDYLGAGLLDRAEELFQQIVDSGTHAQIALEKLVSIYEREGDWQKAIETHRRLEVLNGQKTPHVAHYYCELAERALADGDIERAREYLQNTVRSPSGALRGSLIRARIASGEGRYRDAVGLYRQVIDQNRGFITEVLPDLLNCYEQDSRTEEFEAFVANLAASDSDTNRDIAYAAILHDLTRSPALTASVAAFIADDQVLSHLIDLHALESDEPEHRAQTLERISEGLRMLALSTPRYRCGNCGYGAQRFIWHCPSCKLWETVRPVQRFQLESAVN
ncbi:MAG: tetratricopeptide repeat protein [Gammaproteobacteria bacterium]|jgi:lipopolysaccharide biosynthesis regulator YciM